MVDVLDAGHVDDDSLAVGWQAPYPEVARNLRAEIGMVAQTSDAVWLSVRRVIEPFLDPTLRGRPD